MLGSPPVRHLLACLLLRGALLYRMLVLKIGERVHFFKCWPSQGEHLFDHHLLSTFSVIHTHYKLHFLHLHYMSDIRGLRSRARYQTKRDWTGLENIVTYFSTQQEISRPVPNFGNFSRIPVSFLGLRRDGSWPVPNGGTETGPGRGCSWMLGTGKFPNFPGKNLVPKKRDRERRPLSDISTLGIWIPD